MGGRLFHCFSPWHLSFFLSPSRTEGWVNAEAVTMTPALQPSSAGSGSGSRCWGAPPFVALPFWSFQQFQSRDAEGPGVCFTPLIWPQVVSWWASVVLKVIKLWPSLEWRMLHQVVNIFHLLGFSFCRRAQRYCYVYPLRRNQDPAPRLCYCFLTVPPLSLHPLPSLISNCLNLPFGTQGRSWRLKPIPYKQEMGDTERISCPGAPQGPAQFHYHYPNICIRKQRHREVRQLD